MSYLITPERLPEVFRYLIGHNKNVVVKKRKVSLLKEDLRVEDTKLSIDKNTIYPQQIKVPAVDSKYILKIEYLDIIGDNFRLKLYGDKYAVFGKLKCDSILNAKIKGIDVSTISSSKDFKIAVYLKKGLNLRQILANILVEEGSIYDVLKFG